MTDTSKDETLSRLFGVLEAVKDPAKLLQLGDQDRSSSYSKLLHGIAVNLFWESAECHKLVIQSLAQAAYQFNSTQSLLPHLLSERPLKMGEIPEWTVGQDDKLQVVVNKVSTEEQKVKGPRYCPPEFILDARPFMDKRQADRTTTLFEDFITETVEAVGVRAERLLMACLENKTVTYSRKESRHKVLKRMLETVGLGRGNILISGEVWGDLIGDTEFIEKMMPVSKHDLLLQGQLGTYADTFNIYTDAYRHPEHRFLNQGTMVVMAPKEEIGGVTHRGPWDAEPVTGFTEGRPGKGAWICDSVSLFIREKFLTAQLEQ